tara:strand:+ start:1842 stop:2186 length:345 start_codon:yes stop_codon:yes gene_type:complete
MPIIKTTQVILDVKDPVKNPVKDPVKDPVKYPFKDPLANWLGELYDRDKQNDFTKQILSNIKYVNSYTQPYNVKTDTRRLLKKKGTSSRATRRKKFRKIKSRKLKPDKVKSSSK